MMEFLPVSSIIGYACARVNRGTLSILAMFLLVSPMALLGFQSAIALTPTISTQAYADLQYMASLVSDHSVLVVQGMGVAYWPEYILNLPVVSNSTNWLQDGYDVYLLLGYQGQQIMANGVPNPQIRQGRQDPPGMPSGWPGVQSPLPDDQDSRNPNEGFSQNLDISNATLLYKGTVYSLYKL